MTDEHNAKWSRKVDLSTVFLGLIAAIMSAGVPWAYGINGRLTKIETKLEMISSVESKLAASEIRLNILERKIAVLEEGG